MTGADQMAKKSCVEGALIVLLNPKHHYLERARPWSTLRRFCIRAWELAADPNGAPRDQSNQKLSEGDAY
jgi:hypothetical protein